MVGATTRGRVFRAVTSATLAAVLVSTLTAPVAADEPPGPEDVARAAVLAEIAAEFEAEAAFETGPAPALPAVGVPVLEPEIVLAEGRSARAGEATLVDAGPDALLYRVERDGAWVAYGPGYTQHRQVTTFSPTHVVGEWVIGAGTFARTWVDLQHVTGGPTTQFQFADHERFLAPTPDGWLELSHTDRVVEVVRVTIGVDGALTRASLGEVIALPDGERIDFITGGGVASFDGSTTTVTLIAFVEGRPGAADDLEHRLLRISNAPEAAAPQVLHATRSWEEVRNPVQVSDDLVVSIGRHYLSDGNSIPEIWAWQDGNWRSWRASTRVDDNSVTVVGDRIMWFTGGARVEGLPDGTTAPVTDSWSGLPEAGRAKAVGDGAVVSVGDRVVQAGAGLLGATTLVELPPMPLQIPAFDLEAGTVAWVDDSASTKGEGSAWMRSLVLDRAAIHLYDDAAAAHLVRRGGMRLAGGSVFGYRNDPERVRLVRAERTSATPTEIARAGSVTGFGDSTTTTLLVADVGERYSTRAVLIDVGTNRMTPAPSVAALNESWIVRWVEGTTPGSWEATHRPSGTRRIGVIGDLLAGRLALMGDSLVWLSTNAGTSTISVVDLARGSTATTTSFASGSIIASDATHFVVEPLSASSYLPNHLAVYRLGSAEPVAVVEAVGSWVAVDSGRVLWVDRGPDGERLVSARIPGASLFSDVTPSSPFAAEIDWLVESAIGTGYADGTFRPVSPVSRQAMAAFLFRDLGEAFDAPGTATFTDVPVGSPFFREIEWMVTEGLASVGEDAVFRPTAPVSRQAMAAFLYRAAGEPEFTPPPTPSFPDVPATAPFFTEIEWLAATSVTSGYADGTFRPTAAVSRQAMAAFLHRFDQLEL